MRGFYFENHTGAKIESGKGQVLVAHLDLDPGAYMVWGKLNLGVNVDSGYPPPAWPDAVGIVTLGLDRADDNAYYGVKPASAENNTSVGLMCAATIDRAQRARLYVMNLYPLPVFCHGIRLMALQLDSLSEHEVGEDVQNAPEDTEARIRDLATRARAVDRELLGRLFRP